jgi:hypothetical protein
MDLEIDLFLAEILAQSRTHAEDVCSAELT